MPVKITADCTNPEQGEISLDDLRYLTDTYNNGVDVTGRSGYPQIVKTVYCFFQKRDVEELLAKASDDGGLKLSFAVSLPNQKSCEGADYSNRLTVAIFATDDHKHEYAHVGDLMLTPGFKNPNAINGGDPCCGSMFPIT